MTKPIIQYVLLLFTFFYSSTLSAQNELYISALMDGGLTGGLPKALKLCANTAIPDLSIYGIASVNNGTGSTGQEYALAGSMEAGDCIWIASEVPGFTTFFGCPPDYAHGAMNVNGDDAIELYKSGVVIDLFGDPNMDGTDQCWEYLDGYVVRNSSLPNGGVFDNTCASGDWTYSGVEDLVGVMSYLDIIPSEPFGPYDTECAEVSYYSNVDTIALACAPLKTAIHGLISNQSNLPYGPGASYNIIDFICDNDYQNGAVVDRYAPTNYTDCSGDRYTIITSPSAVGEGWNREHVFPRSWWGNSNTAAQFTDLHNIFPSDAYTNYLKSNYPLGEVLLGLPNVSSIGADGSGCIPGCDNQVFEPIDTYKGDFARTYLYMAIRYENQMASWENLNVNGDAVLNGDSYTVFEECMLARLLLWHQEDPVDDLERNRNEAIFEAQGNRNPMVDHPSWSELIWGTSDGTSVSTLTCETDACSAVQWKTVEITTNSSFNAGGAWVVNGAGYTVNGHCGIACSEAVESWLVYGPLDLSNTTSMFLDLMAEEQYGDSFLDFLWSNDYTGCPEDPENSWTIIGSLFPSDIPFENTPHPVSVDYSTASGASVYLAIRYADDGIDGFSEWILDDFMIDADVCPELGLPIASSCNSCPEDLNADGQIDIADFLEFNSAYGQQCESPADFNEDGIVDVEDFLQLNSVFGQDCE